MFGADGITSGATPSSRSRAAQTGPTAPTTISPFKPVMSEWVSPMPDATLNRWRHWIWLVNSTAAL